MNEKKIILNSIRCKTCKDLLVSLHVHDFRWCSCGKVAIDGGKEYLKRCGSSTDYTDNSVYFNPTDQKFYYWREEK